MRRALLEMSFFNHDEAHELNCHIEMVRARLILTLEFDPDQFICQMTQAKLEYR